MASSLYAPNLDDYLPSDSLPQEPPRTLNLRDLLDISPVLTEAAGAIVDVSGLFVLLPPLFMHVSG